MIVKILMALRLKSRNALFESEHRSEHPHLACVRGSGGVLCPIGQHRVRACLYTYPVNSSATIILWLA